MAVSTKKKIEGIELLVKYLSPHAEGSVVKMTEGSAGFDLVAANIPTCCGFRVVPGHTTMVGSGVAVAIPAGYCGLVIIRSGKNKDGLRLDGGTYLIDADYRGEIMLPLTSSADNGTYVEQGERVAQLLIIPCPAVTVVTTDELPATERGEGGFGSTGK